MRKTGNTISEKSVRQKRRVFKARGKTPFEIIADFNRQELKKLDYFNRPN
jgi:hypothetical protein